MKYAVLGTGMVGRAIAARLAELGHDVVVGTRDPEATLARTSRRLTRRTPRGPREHPGVALATFADAAAGAEVVVHAGQRPRRPRPAGAGRAPTTWPARCSSTSATRWTSRPGFPPTLFVKDTDSLGEQVQRAYPEARVVKTLNTLTADLMVRPDGAARGQHGLRLRRRRRGQGGGRPRCSTEFGHTRRDRPRRHHHRARHRDAAAGVAAADGRRSGTATFNFKIVR